MKTEQLIAEAQESHMNTYARFPVVLAKAAGTKVWDVDGKEYTDFLSGIGALNLGHCPPRVIDAFCAQARKLGHVSNLFYTQPQIDLAAKLARLGGGLCFFGNSGAEANEGALKLARRWAKLNVSPDKTGYVSALKSFHGRTLATLAATGQPDKNRLFEPLPDGFKHVPLNDIDALDEAIDDRICAVVLEVIQGESGVWPATAQYLQAARRLCDERQTLLVFDEVQTGMGRTGEFFAFEHYGVKPDIVTLAKSLAGGFPIGAMVAQPAVAAAFGPGDHGSTFGGGPPVCAAALAAIDMLESDGLIDRAKLVGDFFKDRLNALSDETGAITDVRGLGLMIGVSLKKPIARRLVEDLLGRGFIVNNVGDDILRFLPPLIIEEAEIDELIEALTATLEVADGG